MPGQSTLTLKPDTVKFGPATPPRDLEQPAFAECLLCL